MHTIAIASSPNNASAMIIKDPVHGQIRLSPLQEELIQTVEVQRLSLIRQLGMTFHVYPGAHCSRLSHSLGVSHIAHVLGELLIRNNAELPLDAATREEYIRTVEAAGLLHDIGHTPWSHTLEPLYLRKFGEDHMDLVKRALRGEIRFELPGAGEIPSILRRHGVEPARVAALITKELEAPRYLQQMVFGEVDADQLDYLCRDFHYTGVTFGNIELFRLITTMAIVDDEIVFLAKGLEAVRDFLNARMEMYSSVYLHKKTRIADQMLLRAAERAVIDHGEFPNFHLMTDDELLSCLARDSSDSYVREMAHRIKYRQRLFKRAFHIEAGDATNTRKQRWLQALSDLGDDASEIRRRVEAALLDATGIETGYLFVDLPEEVVRVSEERFQELGIRFLLKNGSVVPLATLDPAFADYVSRAKPTRSLFSVYCEQEQLAAVEAATLAFCEHISD
jgi:HD superfamily phosphohydrolase